jgi:type II secretory pathway pseudopilin PulG
VRSLRRFFRGDGGFTLIELGMAAMLSSLVLGAVVAIFTSVSQGATDARRRADLQVEVRDVVTEMAAELRSAVAPGASAAAVQSMDANTLAFYTDRYPSAGPERILYERTSCSGDYCALRVRRYAAVAGTGPNWTFQTTPFNDMILLSRVAAADRLFTGLVWSGGTRTAVSSCGGGTRCTFPILAIDLQAAPAMVTTIDGPFGVYMEVSFRNV